MLYQWCIEIYFSVKDLDATVQSLSTDSNPLNKFLTSKKNIKKEDTDQ